MPFISEKQMSDYLSKLRTVDYTARNLAEQIADLKAYSTQNEGEDVSRLYETFDSFARALDYVFACHRSRMKGTTLRGYRITSTTTEDRFVIRAEDDCDGEQHEIVLTDKADARALCVALAQWGGFPIRHLAHLLSMDAGSKAGLGRTPSEDLYRVLAELFASARTIARIAEDSNNG